MILGLKKRLSCSRSSFMSTSGSEPNSSRSLRAPAGVQGSFEPGSLSSSRRHRISSGVSFGLSISSRSSLFWASPNLPSLRSTNFMSGGSCLWHTSSPMSIQALRPMWSTAHFSAPASRRAWATLGSIFDAAKCSGVAPLLSFWLGLAPPSSRAFVVSRQRSPIRTTCIRAVMPSRPGPSGSAFHPFMMPNSPVSSCLAPSGERPEPSSFEAKSRSTTVARAL
mmetsp:Transcript_54970/g.161625  ORF Transcript_54970/g.161625 Transcript_54970/m.161625 type:complete len:223 (+) Transcript_54970:1012-1680(+)